MKNRIENLTLGQMAEVIRILETYIPEDRALHHEPCTAISLGGSGDEDIIAIHYQGMSLRIAHVVEGNSLRVGWKADNGCVYLSAS